MDWNTGEGGECYTHQAEAGQLDGPQFSHPWNKGGVAFSCLYHNSIVSIKWESSFVTVQPSYWDPTRRSGFSLHRRVKAGTTVLNFMTLFSAGSVRGGGFCFDIPVLSPRVFHVPWRSCLWSVLSLSHSLSLAPPLPAPSLLTPPPSHMGVCTYMCRSSKQNWNHTATL